MQAIDPERHAFVAFCRSYRKAAPLFTAIELELFDYIGEEGQSLDDLAQSLAIPETNLAHLMNALVCLGFLNQNNDRYFIRENMKRFLRRGPGYLGDFVKIAKQEQEHWAHASDIIRGTYSGPDFEPQTLSSSVVDQTLTNVELNNRASADLALSQLKEQIANVRSVLDVGGGHGYFCQRLLELSEDLRVTIYDLPDVVEYGRRKFRNSSLLSRMDFVGGDARDLDVENVYDLVLMNDLLVYFTHDEKLDVLRRARRALADGGTLAMLKWRLDDSGISPGNSALFSLSIFITTGGGYLERDAELQQMLSAVGFADIQLTTFEDRSWITARRKDG